jgi:hypothetical protein
MYESCYRFLLLSLNKQLLYQSEDVISDRLRSYPVVTLGVGIVRRGEDARASHCD